MVMEIILKNNKKCRNEEEEGTENKILNSFHRRASNSMKIKFIGTRKKVIVK